MAINGHRNKPIGPGGSTRHLHQFQGDPCHGGEIGSTKGVKGVLLPEMVPSLPDQYIVANDNYAPVALAA